MLDSSFESHQGFLRSAGQSCIFSLTQVWGDQDSEELNDLLEIIKLNVGWASVQTVSSKATLSDHSSMPSYWFSWMDCWPCCGLYHSSMLEEACFWCGFWQRTSCLTTYSLHTPHFYSHILFDAWWQQKITQSEWQLENNWRVTVCFAKMTTLKNKWH